MIYAKHYIYVEGCSTTDTYETYMNKLKTAFDSALGVSCEIDYSFGDCRLTIPDFYGKIDYQGHRWGIIAFRNKTDTCTYAEASIEFCHWAPYFSDFWNLSRFYHHIDGRPNSGDASSTGMFYINPLVNTLFIVDTRFMKSHKLIAFSFMPENDSSIGQMVTDQKPNFCIFPIILAETYNLMTQNKGTAMIRFTSGVANMRILSDEGFYTDANSVSAYNTRAFSSDTFVQYMKLQPNPYVCEKIYIVAGSNTVLHNWLTDTWMKYGDYWRSGITIGNKKYIGLLNPSSNNNSLLLEIDD